jgi:hypothetical protein
LRYANLVLEKSTSFGNDDSQGILLCKNCTSTCFFL